MESQVGEESGTGGLLSDDVVSNGPGFAFREGGRSVVEVVARIW